MQTIIISLIVFCVVVLVHEFGHFVVAKMVGIKVHEFSIGMGPKIFGKTKGETLYSLRALPLGGFVRMEGEDEESFEEGSFSTKPIKSRMAVILAGAFMNFILALVVFIIYFMMVGAPLNTNKIGNVIPNQPAYNSGIKAGDIVIRIDDKTVENWEDISKELKNKKEVKVIIERQNEEKEIVVKPRTEENRQIIGIMREVDKSFLTSIKSSFNMFKEMIVLMFQFIGRLFTGNVTTDEVSGPVGVFYVVGQAAKNGLASVLLITGFISVNLGFFNLLPIPALDGSRFVFLLIERIRGKKLDPKKEGMVHIAGFLILILLTIFITFKDITRLFLK